MTITLNGTLYDTLYDTVRDEDGFPVVIRHVRGSMWREASPEVSLRVLKGLASPVVRS